MGRPLNSASYGDPITIRYRQATCSARPIRKVQGARNNDANKQQAENLPKRESGPAGDELLLVPPSIRTLIDHDPCAIALQMPSVLSIARLALVGAQVPHRPVARTARLPSLVELALTVRVLEVAARSKGHP